MKQNYASQVAGGGLSAPPVKGDIQGQKSKYRRLDQFRANLVSFRSNNQDRFIKGFRESDKTTPYLLMIPKVEGLDLDNMKCLSKIGAMEYCTINIHYYMSLLYRNLAEKREERRLFYFGRTAKSASISLVKDKKTNKYNSSQEEQVFFHSSLEHVCTDNVYLVLECVLSVTTPKSAKVPSTTKQFSCGYICQRLFQVSRELVSPSVIDVIQGTPRELVAVIDQTGKDKITDNLQKSKKVTAQIKMCMLPFQNFDQIQTLVPQNMLVSMNDIVPGLNNIKENCKFPKATFTKEQSKKDKKSYKYKSDTKNHMQNFEIVHLHRIEVQGSKKIEKNIEEMMKKMIVNKRQGTEGQMLDVEDVYAIVKERRLVVRQHNGWQYMTEERSVQLSQPSQFNVMSSEQSLSIKNCYINPFSPFIFQLEYIVQVDGNNHSLIVAKYEYIPLINSIMKIDEEDLDVNMTVGPDIAVGNEIVVSEEDQHGQSQPFSEFNMRVFISGNPSPPDQSNLSRSEFSMPDPFKNQLVEASILQPPDEKKKVTSFLSPRDLNDPTLNPLINQNVMGQYQGNIQKSPWDPNFKPYQNQLDQYGKQQFPQDFRITPQDQLKNILEDFLKDPKTYGHNFEETQRRIINEIDQSRQLMKNDNDKLKNYFEDQLKQLQNQQDQEMENQLMHQGFGDPRFQGTFGRGRIEQQNKVMMQMSDIFYNMLNVLGQQSGDEKIIGLTKEIRTMLQRQTFSSISEGNVPFPGQGEINLLKTQDMSEQERNKLAKEGLSDLLYHPTTEIISSHLRQEYLDTQLEVRDGKASHFQIKILSYKTPYERLENTPRRFQFRFRFFSCSEFRSGYMSLVNDTNFFTELKLNQTYFLQKVTSHRPNIEDSRPKSLTDSFLFWDVDIDETKSKVKNENLHFAEYLKERYLTIDIIDAESQFQFGFVKIPLFELLRQGKPVMVRAKECEIFNAEQGQYRGFLNVVLCNQAREPYLKEGAFEHQNITGPNGSSQLNKNKTRRKVISRPMNQNDLRDAHKSIQQLNLQDTQDDFQGTQLTNQFDQAFIENMTREQIEAAKLNPELRKKLIVDRIKRKTMGESAFIKTQNTSLVEDPREAEWVKHKQLKEIEELRNLKKEIMISQIAGSLSSGAEKIHLSPGVVNFYKLPIQNKSHDKQIYNISIIDPERDLSEDAEVSLIYSFEEMQYWADLGKGNQYPYKNTIRSMDTVHVEAGQTVELMFKCLTFRNVSQKVEKSSTDIIKSRIVEIVVLKVGSTQQNLNVKLEVIPMNPLIDLTLKHFEPEHSFFELTVPPFMQFKDDTEYVFRLSKSNARANLDKRSKLITIQGKTGEKMSLNDFQLFVYTDYLCGTLISTIRVEVKALPIIFRQMKAGLQNTLALTFPVDLASQIQVYSSDSRSVFLPQNNPENIHTVIPGMVNYIEVHAKTYEPGEKKVIINAIDYMSGELVYCWLLKMQSLHPKPNEVKYVEALINKFTTAKIMFCNPSKRELLFEFGTSHPKVYKPLDQCMRFRGEHARAIELEIFPQNQVCTYKTYLFINDMEHTVTHCVELHIKFIP